MREREGNEGNQMTPEFVPLEFSEYPPEEMLRRAEAFYAQARRRRTVREFSDRPVPRALIETCLLAAGTAPNGANLQPWHFVAVADPCLLYTSPSPRD